MSAPQAENPMYGLVAEFESPEALMDAAKKTRMAGYTRTDAHVPFPVHGLAEALGMKRSKLSSLVLLGGALGCLGGFYLQYWVSSLEYPLNVGGRPFFSWPAFIPVIFECTVLGAALTSFFGMLTLNGLPQPHHSVFNTPTFDRASNDGFFLTIESADLRFDPRQTKSFLEGLSPTAVHEVEA
jgi:hypothetical protein